MWGNAPKCHVDQMYILHTKIAGLITFSSYNKDFYIPSKYIIREFQVLPFYNLVQNRNSLLMYKIVNDVLPEIMSESCIVNNEMHYHLTKYSHLLHIIKGNKSYICPKLQ